MIYGIKSSSQVEEDKDRGSSSISIKQKSFTIQSGRKPDCRDSSRLLSEMFHQLAGYNPFKSFGEKRKIEYGTEVGKTAGSREGSYSGSLEGSRNQA